MSGFTFKQFHINHDQCAMKVGTDGILLGAWAQLDGAKSVLDIGTGTGLIALMVKQRSPQLDVMAVEIDVSAFKQAQQNIAASPWPNIALVHSDIAQFNATKKFDLIVSNPPYFNHSLQSDNQQRMMARHTDGLSFEKLTQVASELLHAQGMLSVVLPSSESERFISAAAHADLTLYRQLEVKTTATKPVKRILMTFRLQKNTQTHCEQERLIIHDESGAYSTAYKTLCRDFYLNF